MRTVVVLVCFLSFVTKNCLCLHKYSPGDTAPSFELQALDGRLVYKEKASNDTAPSNPIMFCAFTEHSAFLRALWTEEGSVRRLLERSPKNTQYVFLSLSENARDDVKRMRRNIHGEMERLYKEKKNNDSSETKNKHEPGILQNIALFKRDIHKHARNHYNTRIDEDLRIKGKHNVHNMVRRKSIPTKPNHSLEVIDSEHTGESELVEWKKHFHFASFPLFTFGNWIPYVMARWPCAGTGCGLSQVVLKNSKGDIINVSHRLDARYDWQPTPFKHAKHKKSKLRYIPNACDIDKKINASESDVALVSSSGKCSVFRKIQNVAKTGMKHAIVYGRKDEPLTEIKCHDKECYHILGARASMISHEAGEQAKAILTKPEQLYVHLQTTSQDNFFFAIDHRGKLAEMGLFLYPSLHFLAYEAQWFHYEADLMKDSRGHAKVIHVFNHTVMQGPKGAVRKIHIPKDYLTYRNVELDMSLKCPDAFDSSCPHWDHVVHLTVCCEKNHELCGAELGRWVTPYARSIGRWLTPITALLPLFTSSSCTLTMKTVPWEMPWTPTLNIRFSDHILDSKDGYSKKRYSPELIPYKILKLFSGGIFDKGYNKRHKQLKFLSPKWSKKVELVAIITGHGKDNNGCAEFCVTSHHFLINEKSESIKVFKNAATAMGCANRVEQGVEPNEHGTWLYGRDGWCPGQEVVPWVVDVTKQIELDKENHIKYFSYYNGLNPNPKHAPGNIEMSSYLVFYKDHL